MSLVKSKQRVADHGEVFTPDVLIFYPSLTACFVVTLILLTKWLKESADSAIPDQEH